MLTIGEIAGTVRDYLGIGPTRVSDDSIIRLHNAHARDLIRGLEWQFAIATEEHAIEAGTERTGYPSDYRSIILAVAYHGEDARKRDVKVVSAQEAKRLGIPKGGRADVLIDDGAGFQLQNIPEDDFRLRFTYQAWPKRLAGTEDSNYLTEYADSMLTHFLTHKAALVAKGMLEESRVHFDLMKEARELLYAENMLQALANVEVAGAYGDEATYGREGGNPL